MGKAAKGSGGKSSWSKIASGKGSSPAAGEKGSFGKGKASSTKGAKKPFGKRGK